MAAGPLRLVLLPSPLLGPASWGAVPEELVALGHEARVVAVGAVDTASGSVLVPHSNAGYWTPRLIERSAAVGAVYVDAALPAYGEGETALAPPDFRDFLTGLAGRDGLLPPWTQWWDDVDGLFPDEQIRRAVEAEQPRLPLSWFDRRLPVPAGWEAQPAAYLGFGETYAEEQRFATDAGWPVTRLDGGHLHHLHDPAGVANAIADLANRVVGLG